MTAMSDTQNEDLSALSKGDLYERATALDIEGRSSMSKDELIAAIKSTGLQPGVPNGAPSATQAPPDEPGEPTPDEEANAKARAESEKRGLELRAQHEAEDAERAAAHAAEVQKLNEDDTN